MKTLLIFLLICLAGMLAWSQTSISGTVRNKSGAPLVGANVYIKNSFDGNTTDANGNFTFKAYGQDSAILVASYISYESFEKKVLLTGKNLHMDIVLKEDAALLDVVTISAGMFEAGDEKKAVVLNSLDIVTTAGAGADVISALRTLPGAQIAGNETGLYVRGGEGREAATFIDGVKVSHPYYSYMPDISQRGRFSPFLFQGTYFSTGGYSAEYGQALSSALVLNTTGIPEESFTTISFMSLGLGGGHSKVWKKGSVGVFADYFDMEPYYQLAPQNLDWVEAPKALDASVMFRHKISESGMIKFYSQFNTDKSGFYTHNPETLVKDQLFESKNNNLYNILTLNNNLGKHWMVFGGMSYTYNSDDLKIGTDDVFVEDHVTATKLKFKRKLGEFSAIQFGSEFQNFKTDNTYNQYDIKLDDNFFSLFTESDIYLSKQLVLRAGLRSEYDNIIDKLNVAPRASVAYKTGETSQLSLAYGQFFQNPAKEYLYFNAPDDYEKADHYILNFQKMESERTFRIETYYKDYKQLLTTVPDTSLSGSGEAYGFDLFWRDKKSIKHADYWISYSFLETSRKYLNYPISATPDYASKHTLTLVYKHFIPKWSISLGGTYVIASGRPYYNPNNEEFLGDRTKAYQNLSFNASYLTQWFGSFTVTNFSVSNLMGYENIHGYYYSTDGSKRIAITDPAKRFYFLGLFMSFGRDNTDDI